MFVVLPRLDCLFDVQENRNLGRIVVEMVIPGAHLGNYTKGCVFSLWSLQPGTATVRRQKIRCYFTIVEVC